MGRSPLTVGLKSVNEKVGCAIVNKENGHANTGPQPPIGLLCCLSCFLLCILMGVLSPGKFPSTPESRVENIQKWADRGLTKWGHIVDFLAWNVLSRQAVMPLCWRILLFAGVRCKADCSEFVEGCLCDTGCSVLAVITL